MCWRTFLIWFTVANTPSVLINARQLVDETVTGIIGGDFRKKVVFGERSVVIWTWGNSRSYSLYRCISQYNK
ncbi:MAG: hypothetical protein FWF77_01140, partial [Defluviitaleaceae bacterium]|nr:hypothetical protein [Defluviitaleaceae bacterium]